MTYSYQPEKTLPMRSEDMMCDLIAVPKIFRRLIMAEDQKEIKRNERFGSLHQQKSGRIDLQFAICKLQTVNRLEYA